MGALEQPSQRDIDEAKALACGPEERRHLPAMSAEEVAAILEDKKTMEQIEKEIKQITDGQAN